MGIEQTLSHLDPIEGETEGYITAGDVKSSFIQTYNDFNALVPDGLEVTKTYVDQQDSYKLDKVGGTMTGPLTLNANPSNNLQAATKQYADTGDAAAKAYADSKDALKLDKAGDTMTGDLVVDGEVTAYWLGVDYGADMGTSRLTSVGPPIDADDAATKEYVDAAMPLGTIVAYGASTAPTGWHLCNGTAHGSSELQTLLGSANTPDLRDRFIVGAGSSYAQKATGGATSHSHTSSAHSHGLGAGHAQIYSANTGDLLLLRKDPVGAYTPNMKHVAGLSSSSGAGPSSTLGVGLGGTTDSTTPGSTGSAGTLPPYYALTYIIKK